MFVNFTQANIHNVQLKKLSRFNNIIWLIKWSSFLKSCQTWAFVTRLHHLLVSWHSGSSSVFASLILENFCHKSLEKKSNVFVVVVVEVVVVVVVEVVVVLVVLVLFF